MTFKNRLYQVLRSQCEADITSALLALDLSMNSQKGESPVHEQILTEANAALDKLTKSRDRLDTLNTYHQHTPATLKKLLHG